MVANLITANKLPCAIRCTPVRRIRVAVLTLLTDLPDAVSAGGNPVFVVTTLGATIAVFVAAVVALLALVELSIAAVRTTILGTALAILEVSFLTHLISAMVFIHALVVAAVMIVDVSIVALLLAGHLTVSTTAVALTRRCAAPAAAPRFHLRIAPFPDFQNPVSALRAVSFDPAIRRAAVAVDGVVIVTFLFPKQPLLVLVDVEPTVSAADLGQTLAGTPVTI
jgi:hypothetical protein